MKKVIGVAVAASLVAGMAFADVAVSLNARMRSNMYHQAKDDNNTLTSLFDLDGSKYADTDGDGDEDDAFTHGGSGIMQDTLKFAASNDFAGVVLEANANASSAAGKELKGKTYYGFMKFGALKFTFGTFESVFIGRHGQTAAESGLLDSDDIAKYGITLLKSKSKVAFDANNISCIAGDKVDALFADYTVDAGEGKLMLKGGLLSNAYKTTTGSDKTYTRAGYAFEGDYQSDVVNVQALVKLPKEKVTVFGVYVEPKVMAELPLAFGFSYGKDDNTYTNASAGAKGTGYAIDARVGYIVSDALRVDSVIKYESAKPDGGKTGSALTVAAEGSYVVNDLATVFADVGYYNYNLGDTAGFDKKSVIKFRPGVKLSAGKNAAVTAALQYDSWSGDDKDCKSEMSIPVIFRVKF